jgi:alkaline phosphatase
MAQPQRGSVLGVLVAAFLAAPAVGLLDRGRQPASRPEILAQAEFGPVPISAFGQPPLSAAVLDRGRHSGLCCLDQPSIGSGLDWIGGTEFVGVSDRGPNDTRPEITGKDGAVLFVLPEFTPSLVRFDWTARGLTVRKVIPLHDSRGRGISGLPNSDDDDVGLGTPGAATPLPHDPNGLDVEGVRRFPGGMFLLADEYAPSVVVASATGQILVRYVAESWKLAGASYPVRGLLPDFVRLRRKNRGFESVALSRDGTTAYALLETPIGPASDPALAQTRVARALRLDVSKPLQAAVTGVFAIEMTAAADYSVKTQLDVRQSDAAWAAADRVLVVERVPGRLQLVLLDFSSATNLVKRPESAALDLEKTSDLSSRGIAPARRQVVLDSRELPAIDANLKIEGLAIVSRTEVVLITDNDFGMNGSERTGPSRVWRIRLASALPVDEPKTGGR